eukprot:TRINITY_DN2326_c0_g1_i1.p1 TRINITY_DN2326_c0_g1~~TRINITY_DN2326_c0_g1_i1.p1  ORF type:complete len:358 (+),score=34.72 TRINITY_DN2326_c0_g1_i1:789-1862(+)
MGKNSHKKPSAQKGQSAFLDAQKAIVTNLLTEAQSLDRSGKFREAADNCRLAYEEASLNDEGRFLSLSSYTEFFRQQQIEPTASDLQFLERLSNRGSEPNLDRVCGTVTLAFAALFRHDIPTAVDCFRRTLALADRMKDEKDYIAGTIKSASGVPAKVYAKALVKDTAEKARQLLKNFEGEATGHVSRTLVKESGSSGIRLETRIGYGEAATDEDQEFGTKLIAKMVPLRVGGHKCDNCLIAKGSESGERGSEVKLKMCTKCKRAWYCSAECQKLHWKASHKAVCRAPSDFHVRDMVVVHGLTGEEAPWNGLVLEVRAKDGERGGKWFVAGLGGLELASIDAVNIRLVLAVEQRGEL